MSHSGGGNKGLTKSVLVIRDVLLIRVGLLHVHCYSEPNKLENWFLFSSTVY